MGDSVGQGTRIPTDEVQAAKGPVGKMTGSSHPWLSDVVRAFWAYSFQRGSALGSCPLKRGHSHLGRASLGSEQTGFPPPEAQVCYEEQ